MYCSNCGKKREDHSEKCEHCGYEFKTETERVDESNQDHSLLENTPFTCAVCRKIVFNKSGKCPHCGNPVSGIESEGTGFQTPYYLNQKKRELKTSNLIFSIVNIALGCCGTGFILGVIALVFTFKARDSFTDEDEAKYNKLAFVINVVSLILTVISVIIGIAYYVYYLEMLEEFL